MPIEDIETSLRKLGATKSVIDSNLLPELETERRLKMFKPDCVQEKRPF